MVVNYNDNGELTMGGTSLKTIAQSFGTPSIVYDEDQIRNQIRRYHKAFEASGLSYNISYASKAFTCIQMVKLIDEENLQLDVVSEGELYTALEAGFDSKRIHFHGNNKTKREIQYALDSQIGYFVVDTLEEIDLIDKYADSNVDVVLRVNPGVIKTAKIVLNWLASERIEVSLLNIGGGFGIKYVEGDESFPIEQGISEITEAIKETAQALQYNIPEIGIEPGRSIVGEAGITLYEVGTIKDIPGVNKYVSVDGGMSDHIRTALYGAQYEALLVNRNEKANESVTIAGKLCESGDIIVRDAQLPSSVHRGDYLAVLSTGAYHYSMASNYNQMQKPPVFFLKDGKAREVIKRQSLRQLIINDTK